MRHFLLFFFFSFNLAAQVSIQELKIITFPEEGKFYYPDFNPSGDKLIFTSENYKGLILLDINTGEKQYLNDYEGAGFNPRFSNDGASIFLRKSEYKNNLKYTSLVKYSIPSASENIIIEPTRRLPVYSLTKNDRLIIQNSSSPIIYDVKSGSFPQNSNFTEKVVTIENRQIILYDSGRKIVLEPLGEGVYVWASLSPDAKRILFTLGARGTFICDLNGNIIAELGHANAPEWSPDGKWIVCMKDYDDGDKFIGSDIYLLSADGKISLPLTNLGRNN